MVFSLQLSALSFLLFGCNVLPEPQADPVRYFTLSGPVAAVTSGATVRPVQVAGHLRGRPMAIRVGPNEVIYDENSSWAEPLDEAITLVLRGRLGTVGAGRSIAVQVQRCELVQFEGNSVQLAATYAITGPAGAVQRGTFQSAPRTWDGKDRGALVAQLREAVGELGDALASAVEK